jgi:hypothetical protein
MPALSRGQASDCSNPVLDIFTTTSGGYVDVQVLEFEIFEKVTSPSTWTKAFPVSGRFPVDLTACPAGDKLSTGRYVASYTPPLTALIGTYQIRWYFKLVLAAPEQTITEEFEVLPEVVGSTSTGYTSISALRDEGVTTAQASDGRLTTLIARCSRMIERWTGRWFEPRSHTFLLDGHGGRTLILEQPIIRIDTVRLLETDDVSGIASDDLDLAGLRVYNRHISQSLIAPDDRDDPRIEWSLVEGYRAGIWGGRWPEGSQNVFVSGIFGYTEPDGSPFGRTPADIELATQMLVIRNLAKLADTEARQDAILASRITDLRTRDQSISYARAPGNSTRVVGAFSGDPEIDAIVAQYCRPPMMAAV